MAVRGLFFLFLIGATLDSHALEWDRKTNCKLEYKGLSYQLTDQSGNVSKSFILARYERNGKKIAHTNEEQIDFKFLRDELLPLTGYTDYKVKLRIAAETRPLGVGALESHMIGYNLFGRIGAALIEVDQFDGREKWISMNSRSKYIDNTGTHMLNPEKSLKLDLSIGNPRMAHMIKNVDFNHYILWDEFLSALHTSKPPHLPVDPEAVQLNLSCSLEVH